MTTDFVTIKGEKIYIDENGVLDIHNKGITDITEITGLENLTNLKILNLWGNQIEEIKGLENLTNLQEIYLSGNPIRKDEKHLVKERDAQEIVKYCQKIKKVETIDQRMLNKWI